MLASTRYGTRDLARSAAFYDEIAAILGASRLFSFERTIAWRGPDGGMFMIGPPLEGEASVGNGTQIGLIAPSRAAVDAVHARALELGSRSEGEPGFRGPPERELYACYFRDPDGHKIMVYNAKPI